MGMIRHTAILMVAAAASSASATAGPATKGDAPVLATLEAFSSARAGFKADELARLLTPDYVEVSPRGEIDRRAAVLGFYAADKAGPVPPMAYSTQDVRRYGGTAIVIGSIEYTMPGPKGSEIKRTVRATYVQRRVSGRWLMASAQFTGVAAAPAR